MIRLAYPPYRLIPFVIPLLASPSFMAQAADGIDQLATFGGTYSAAWGVSADGSVVVGGSYLADDVTKRAFRWESGTGMVDLGTLGGTNSWAYGMSADGTVVVGEADTPGDAATRAFRWESGSGMVDLGTLGGTTSFAYAVSANGSVVVGEANTAGDAAFHAFRWESGSGMVDLGTLGGTSSRAYGTSANGSVVVGESDTPGDASSRAFRWDNGTGMVDLGTLGGATSSAWGVSGTGAVVVGWSDTAGGTYHAFRWESGGMVDLGTLGGAASLATATSADGLVVVGTAQTPGDVSYRAFRWTQASGMKSVEDWLRAAGVMVPTDITKTAYAASQNGSVVVGLLENDQPFIARVAPLGSGLLTLDDARKSLSDGIRGGSAALESSQLILQGAHSRPLQRRAGERQNTFWMAGDWGRDEHGARDGDLGLAEVGFGRNFGALQLNLSFGQTWAKQAWSLGGQANADGSYLLAEALIPVHGSLWAVLGGYRHWGDAKLRRGYLNVVSEDSSSGSSSTNTWGIRARLELDQAVHLANVIVSPYVDVSYGEARLAAYNESGGSFPAHFDARKERLSELRLGANAVKPLTENTSLVAILEATHRFEKESAASSVELIGLGSLRLDGQTNQRDWLRAGLGLEGRLAGGSASLMVNVTSRGEVPGYWLAASWQKSF